MSLVYRYGSNEVSDFIDCGDAIVASITGPTLGGAVCTLRISGASSQQVLTRLVTRYQRIIDSPRKLILSDVVDPFADNIKIDSALVAFFKAPKSYTGEDCVEISLHSSTFIVNRCLEVLEKLGVRVARPGEFTERAYHNGCLDLVQAEAVADLIAAETEAQMRIAHRQLDGELSSAVYDLGEPLRQLLSEIEAFIDFPEEDIEPTSLASWCRELEAMRSTLNYYLDTYQLGKVYREGIDVVISGIPNAGKSSLLNALIGQERAIVTPIPGTTRDSLREFLSINGVRVSLWDTAGIVNEKADRDVDLVESIGIQRSFEKVRDADTVLFVFDGSQQLESQFELYEKICGMNANVEIIINKIDVVDPSSIIAKIGDSAYVEISVLEKQGLDTLRSCIGKNIIGEGRDNGSLLLSNRRHVSCFQRAYKAVNQALDVLNQGEAAEIIAFEIRSALSDLEEVVGVTTADDVLGMIFSKFCIGK